MTAGCTEGRDVFFASPADRARAFIEAEGLPGVRWYSDVLSYPERDLLLFGVEYGERHDTPVGPAYETAYGLVVEDRVGWVVPPRVLGKSGTRFDVLPRDAGILDQAFLGAVRDVSVSAYDPVRILLAGDPDSTEETLGFIARSLARGGSVAIGEALLENPTVRASYPVLSALVRATMLVTKWRDVHERAWRSVEPLVAPLETLSRSAILERPAAGEIRSVATFHNPTGTLFLGEYVGMCAVAILVYDDPTLGASPRWNGYRWQNTQPGGCKALRSIAEVRAGESHELTAWASDSIILGDSLAAGRYWLAVRVRFVEPADTTLVIPAGEMELSR
ncbi:MAG: hypothetical protein R3326_04150 [Gemmatimonadota bacterium]|nr:hypothetical protein [Gemmatimonadota bacterium]